ncbi:4436_t:CDS:2, partial [Gigaspora margarita]
FEDIYLRTYYLSPTIDQVMIDSENDTSIFENHADDFFEYAARQTQIIENDPLCEVKRCASLDINTIAALMCQRNWLDAAEKFG